MKVITIATEKGGTGKTTTAQALIESLRAKKYKVLGIDLDSQFNLSFAFKCDVAPYSIYDVLTTEPNAEKVDIGKAIYNDFIKATFLSHDLQKAKDTALRKALQEISNFYDFVVIDTSPKLDNILTKALISSDFVIIPTQAEAYAIKGIDNIFGTINSNDVKTQNPNLKVLGVLLTMYNERSNLHRQLKDLISQRAKAHNTILFETTIHKNIAIAEAQALRLPLLAYGKGIKAVEDYKKLTNEILKLIETE